MFSEDYIDPILRQSEKVFSVKSKMLSNKEIFVAQSTAEYAHIICLLIFTLVNVMF